MKNLLFYPNFKHLNLTVFSTTRKHGSMKTLGKINNQNLKKALLLKNLDSNNLVLSEQIHGINIEEVVDANEGLIKQCDGVITRKKGLVIGIITADCLPIVFWDSDNKILAVIHAGCKGILEGIVQNLILKLKKMGADIKNLKMLIGPSICGKCYEVSEKLIKDFKEKFLWSSIDGRFLDLKNIAFEVAVRNGLSSKNIEISNLCTKENSSFLFSARASKNKNFGEFATFALIS
ncbi:peptidoglycan editing factor PgeF [Patescibacteria group bacterium]|nr:peptidoglycan editing factor PgeF [Patescibacteria group bacterium]